MRSKNGEDMGRRVLMTKPHVIIVVDNPAPAIELSTLVKKNGYTVAATVSRCEDVVNNEGIRAPRDSSHRSVDT